MELTHLKYFVTVAEELHFGRAAARLHMAQPPLSQQIMRLEDELQVKLFERSSRKVELTPAGKIFLEDARGIIAHATASIKTMAEIADGASGHLAIGFNEPAINTFLSSSVKKFTFKYPGVKLSLLELETPEQIDALNSRRIHLGIMRPFGYDLGTFQTRLLWTEKYVLAIPEQHPLRNSGTVCVSSLKNEKFIMFPRSFNPALHNHIVEALKFKPEIAQEAVSKQTILALVDAGLGIALVPESTRCHEHSGILFKPLSGNLPRVEIYAAWSKDISSVMVKNFLDISANFYPEIDKD